MQLTISVSESQVATIIGLSGRIVAGEEVDILRKQVHELLRSNKTKIVLSLEGVTRIDSTGIGMLVEAVIYTVKQGGQLKLSKVPRLVHNILHTHRLLQAFEIYETDADALASFQESTPKPAA
jgi:anti-sigma B factor antagonist